MEMAGKFLEKMYRTDADFVFTVTRDSVRQLHTNWSLQELQCDAFEARWRALRSLGAKHAARQAGIPARSDNAPSSHRGGRSGDGLHCLG